jgi:hypothetical protein
VVLVGLVGVGAAVAAGGGGKAADRARLAQLPRGGRVILPGHRVIAFYGAPQSPELGTLGIGTPEQAGRRLRHQAAKFRSARHPVLPAFELLAAVANQAPGDDGLYRTRQSGNTIARYLAAARRARALLILDIQPGHADFMTETRALEPWLREPDVSLALDPEWHTPGGVPGKVIGSVDALAVNDVSAYLSGIVQARRLPQKLLVVHRFTAGMIRDDRLLVQRPGVALAVNVDGFGDRANKLARYHALTGATGGVYDGLKLFYKEDTNLMTPREVLHLEPAPALVVYE